METYMNKFDHIKDLNDSLEELNNMQDRVLDNYNSQETTKKQKKNLLMEISSLKKELQDLIKDFEKLP
jgi:hypothetical protein